MREVISTIDQQLVIFWIKNGDLSGHTFGRFDLD